MSNFTDMASYTFRPVIGGMYRCVKSRQGNVIIGGLYSRAFIEELAKTVGNVYIDHGKEEK